MCLRTCPHGHDLQIDETGTVGAASTAVEVDVPECKLHVFRADHPFAFFIVDDWDMVVNTECRPTVLFAGVVANPKQ